MSERLHVLRHVFALSVRADPAVAAVIVVVVLLQGASVSLLALAQRRVVDAEGVGVTTGLVLAVLLGAVAYASGAAGNRIQNNLRGDLSDRVNLTLTQEVLEATTRVPTVEHLERPDYLNRLTSLRNGTDDLAGSCWSVAETAVSIASLVVSVWLLVSVSPPLGILALLGVPPLLLGRRGQQLIRRVRDECAEEIRFEQRLHELCIQPEPAKEVRIARNGLELSRRADALWSGTSHREVRAQLHGAVWELAGWSCFAVGFLVAVLVVTRLVIDGNATLGDVVLVITLASRLQPQISMTIFGANQLGAAGHVASHYLWLRDYAASQQLDGQPPPERLDQGITLTNVSFRYPNAEADTLHDVTLRLPAGGMIGLVGVNGAGKTTLVKLLAGVYRPTRGEIAVDGRPLQAIEPAGWSHRLSGALQDFVKLQSSCRESIGIGDLPRCDDDAAIWTAIDRAGADRTVATLPNGIETVLGRTFDGVDLSHGQWQKLALARAMMRDEPLLLILDEPTAALDPQAEHDLFERFVAQARTAADRRGAVTVLVSHRFSTLHMASLIVVLDGGRIVEQGSHAELMASNGQYAQLFRLQARSHGRLDDD
jgi:ATP-binding cassette, subfamily B, bacterial